MATNGMASEPMTTMHSCEKCDRTFSTEQGLINHLAKVHADREKQTSMKPTKD